jgi:hypothetical protein
MKSSASFLFSRFRSATDAATTDESELPRVADALVAIDPL